MSKPLRLVKWEFFRPHGGYAHGCDSVVREKAELIKCEVRILSRAGADLGIGVAGQNGEDARVMCVRCQTGSDIWGGIPGEGRVRLLVQPWPFSEQPAQDLVRGPADGTADLDTGSRMIRHGPADRPVRIFDQGDQDIRGTGAIHDQDLTGLQILGPGECAQQSGRRVAPSRQSTPDPAGGVGRHGFEDVCGGVRIARHGQPDLDHLVAGALAPILLHRSVLPSAGSGTWDQIQHTASSEWVPNGRFGRPDEIAGAVTYLCGGYISGATILVYGGAVRFAV